VTRFAVAAGALVFLACAPAPAPPPSGSAAAQADTLRGTVEEVGSDPGMWMVIHTPDGRAVRLDGERTLLRQVVGLEVMVRGTPVQGGFAVREIDVRASGGIPAMDGVLERRSSAYVLVTRDGRALPIARLPDDLRGMLGARIWIAGPLDQPPQSSGILSGPAQ
jgi:hypothetical protein